MSGYACIGLYQPKTTTNIGSALRACGCFGASMIAVSGRRYKKSPTDTMKQYRHIPLLQVDDLLSVIPYDCVPVCVEINENSISLENYCHEKRAYYIFGPEDGSVPNEIAKKCKHTISIPSRYCLNLAMAVKIVLYDRSAKEHKQRPMRT